MSFHFSVYYSFNQVTQIAFTADQVEYTHQSETAKVLWPVLFYREGLNNPSYEKSYQNCLINRFCVVVKGEVIEWSSFCWHSIPGLQIPNKIL